MRMNLSEIKEAVKKLSPNEVLELRVFVEARRAAQEQERQESLEASCGKLVPKAREKGIVTDEDAFDLNSQ